MQMLDIILLHVEAIVLYPFFCYLTLIKSGTPPGSITNNIYGVQVLSSCPATCNTLTQLRTTCHHATRRRANKISLNSP